MSSPPGPPPLPSPGPPQAPLQLTPDQFRAIANATASMRRIKRAIAVARFDGWSLALCAGLTILIDLTSPTNYLIGLVLGTIAYLELHWAKDLTNLIPKAAKHLALNQLALAGTLILYALWSLLFPAKLPAEVLDSAKDLQSLGLDIESIQSSLNQLVYFSLILIALCVQVPMAYFYFRRERMTEEYLRQTPEWVVQMQRAGVAI